MPLSDQAIALIQRYVTPPYPQSMLTPDSPDPNIYPVSEQPPPMPLMIDGRPTKRFQAGFEASSVTDKFKQLWALMASTCERVSQNVAKIKELNRQRDLGKAAIEELRAEIKDLQDRIHAMEMAQERATQIAPQQPANDDAGTALAIAKTFTKDIELIREILLLLTEKHQMTFDDLTALVKTRKQLAGGKPAQISRVYGDDMGPWLGD